MKGIEKQLRFYVVFMFFSKRTYCDVDVAMNYKFLMLLHIEKKLFLKLILIF